MQDITPAAKRSRRTVRGAYGGVIATVPMTLLMLAIHRFLPKWQRYSLPPEEVSDWMLRRLGIRGGLSRGQLVAFAALSHFSFGSSLGAVYRVTTGKRAGDVRMGLGYGLLVYLANYAGWLPVAGVLDPPWRAPRGRVAMMTLAHLVYGSALALVAKGSPQEVRELRPVPRHPAFA